jgi:tetratricopeptide (TPR) repeat protein
MRKLIERLGRDLDGFVEQRDDLLLLLACSAEDSALVLKVLRDRDRMAASDVYLLFADDFLDASSFVTKAVERLHEEHAIANAGAEQEGKEPLPPVPAALGDTTRPAAPRLQEAFTYARSLLPEAGGHRLVWAMFPAKVADWTAYLQLVSACSPARGIQPWMRGTRLIFRVEADFALGSSPLVGVKGVRQARADFGQAALQAGLQEEAADLALPQADRMQALLALAALDGAHDRTAEATRKYSILYEYFVRAENPLMQALVLNGLGDMPHKQGDLEKARHWYECAVPPAAAAEQPLVLSVVVQNLAAVAFEGGKFAEAEEYYGQLSELKQLLLDEEGKAEALEWRGLAQEKQAEYDRAVQSWEQAELISRAFELRHRLRRVLEHLRRAYRQLRVADKLAGVEEELRGWKD